MEDGKHRADEKRMNPLAFGSIARLWHLRKILPAGPVAAPFPDESALRTHYLSHIQQARESGYTHFAEALTKVFERTFTT